mmetsp:Transcript_13559/g.46858  ORF Transcript_13559/g.46858 Transcript_13559/m.46858 type:complete len:277 (+) Transcript_13559:646-1476(+)
MLAFTVKSSPPSTSSSSMYSCAGSLYVATRRRMKGCWTSDSAAFSFMMDRSCFICCTITFFSALRAYVSFVFLFWHSLTRPKEPQPRVRRMSRSFHPTSCVTPMLLLRTLPESERIAAIVELRLAFSSSLARLLALSRMSCTLPRCFLNTSRVISRHLTTGLVATTSAARGASFTSACSPKKSPSPRVARSCIWASLPWRLTFTSPWTTMWKVCPGAPDWMMTSPSLYVISTSASHTVSSSELDSELISGTRFSILCCATFLRSADVSRMSCSGPR